jgi:hypothetical protein
MAVLEVLLCLLGGMGVYVNRLQPEYNVAATIISLLTLFSYAVFCIFIYPTLLSPLRHLPEPEVSPASDLFCIVVLAHL